MWRQTNLRICSSLLLVLLGAFPTGCSSESPVAAIEKQPNEPATSSAARHSDVHAIGSEFDQLNVPESSPSEPVTAAMLIRPDGIAQDETAELVVLVRIARAHYLHAADASDKTFTPLSIEVLLPEGINADGEWKFPPPEKVHGTRLGYRGSIMLRRALKSHSILAPQNLVLTAELHYQACTDELCWPPGIIKLNAPLTIRSRTR